MEVFMVLQHMRMPDLSVHSVKAVKCTVTGLG